MSVEARPRLITPAFLLIAFSTLAYFTAEGALLPTVPLYTKGPLGGGEVAVGVVVGAFSVTALVLRPFVGRLADRRGRRLVMLVGMVLFGLSIAGYLVADTIPLMIVMRLVTGAGAAFFFVGAATAVTDIAPPERRGEAVSFFSLALYAGVGWAPSSGSRRSAATTSPWPGWPRWSRRGSPSCWRSPFPTRGRPSGTSVPFA